MADNEFIIRPLKEGDLNEWLRLRRCLWDGSDDDDHMSEMVDIIEHSDSQFVAVAETVGGKLAAFLEASIRSHVEDCQTDHVGYLEGWFVEEQFREKGIGRRLVSLAEAWAIDQGCSEMGSDVEIGNSISQQAHEKLGYTVTSKLIHLRKELVK